MAVEVAPKEHWSELQALICVVSDAKKGTPSTAGMQRTVATSPLLQHRIREVVPARMKDISQAIQSRDFNRFAEITMADSNNFHATCLDTSPPIFYMNDVSRAIVQLVEEVNRASEEAGKGKIVAYTYDAGPNAVLYAPKENVALVLGLIRHYFPNADFDDTVSTTAHRGERQECRKSQILTPCHPSRTHQFNLLSSGANASHRGSAQAPAPLPTQAQGLPAGFNSAVIPVHEAGAVRRLIHTQVGDGPRLLARGGAGGDAEEVGLLNAQGEPKRLQRSKRA